MWTHPYPDICVKETNNEEAAGVNDVTKPRYESMSYAWGSTESPEMLDLIVSAELSNTSPEKLATLEITQNLAGAVRHLRHLEGTKDLWIDVIW